MEMHYAGICIEGPEAGVYRSGPKLRFSVEGFEYRHRVLVKFTNGQSIEAWVPVGMTNATAVQRVFDAYAVSVTAKEAAS
jgi:hypothetical protein